jgi:hypothetical protein
MKYILLLSLIFTLQTFSQKEVYEETPKQTILFNEELLLLNGSGLREKFFIDLYVGSLYLKTKSSNAHKILNSSDNKVITLDILSNLITSDKMLKGIDDGFEKSTGGNIKQFHSEIIEFKDAFKEEIKKGDNFLIGSNDNNELLIFKNGVSIKTIKGYDFSKAVFGIWLGEDPADENLLEDMLGLN